MVGRRCCDFGGEAVCKTTTFKVCPGSVNEMG